MKTPIFLYQDSSFNVVLRRRSNINLTYQELKFVTRERPVLYNVDQDPVHEEPYQNVYQEKRDGIPSEEVMHGPGRQQAKTNTFSKGFEHHGYWQHGCTKFRPPERDK